MLFGQDAHPLEDRAELPAPSRERVPERVRLGDLDLDVLVVEVPLAQTLAEQVDLADGDLLALYDPVVADDEGLAVLVFLVEHERAPRGRGEVLEELDEDVLGVLARARGHAARLLALDQLDGELDEVPDHRLDVSPDVADLGELRGLDLEAVSYTHLRAHET